MQLFYINQSWKFHFFSNFKFPHNKQVNSGIITANLFYLYRTNVHTSLLIQCSQLTIACWFILNPRRLIRTFLVFLPLLLLSYSFNSQSLSTNTTKTIQGAAPYLTFDGGNTKVTSTNGLLAITLSNGTTITPATNSSTTTNPIELPNTGESFTDIKMLVPATTNSITLNTLISTPNNYWGDDDGDGKGVNGIKATGSLSVSITDKDNQVVSRGTVLNLCNAPYKLMLSGTDGVLSTQYGDPISSIFSADTATYYIKPKSSPVICHAKPSLLLGTDMYLGPTNIWSPKEGFFPQSTDPVSYGRNFPTTGANNLYFDLGIVGSDPLIWSAVTKGGITATVTPTPGEKEGTSVRVSLTGPVATISQINSSSPSLISKPNLPQQFELVGKNSSGKDILKYGFELKQWFVNRGDKDDTNYNQNSWCTSLGYRLSRVKDLTNAVCAGLWSGWFCQGAIGATPSSNGNHYQRNIGAGLFTEWGRMDAYTDSGFFWRNYWTSDTAQSSYFVVDEDDADVYLAIRADISSTKAVCVYP